MKTLLNQLFLMNLGENLGQVHKLKNTSIKYYNQNESNFWRRKANKYIKQEQNILILLFFYLTGNKRG